MTGLYVERRSIVEGSEDTVEPSKAKPNTIADEAPLNSFKTIAAHATHNLPYDDF